MEEVGGDHWLALSNTGRVVMQFSVSFVPDVDLRLWSGFAASSLYLHQQWDLLC